MIYDINFFIEVKNNISDEHITSSLQDKITKLFSSFECFNENKYNSKYNTNSNKYNNNSKFKSQKNKYKKYYNIEKKNPRRIKNKTDIDIILSYLNKITISNYNDLSIKICDNISDDNYEKIINKLFEISFKQSTYTELYINLYKKILFPLHNKIFKILNKKPKTLFLILHIVFFGFCLSLTLISIFLFFSFFDNSESNL